MPKPVTSIMRISPCLSRFYHSSWGLALLLPLILMPVSSMLSVRLWVPGGYVYLIYLPLALMIAMLQVYDWGAMPGIILGLITYYFHHYPPAQAAIIVCVFISVLVCGWAGLPHPGSAPMECRLRRPANDADSFVLVKLFDPDAACFRYTADGVDRNDAIGSVSFSARAVFIAYIAQLAVCLVVMPDHGTNLLSVHSLPA